MPELVLEEGWKEKLQDLAARRRDLWPLLVLVGAAAAIGLLLASRGPAPQIAPPAQPGPVTSPAASPTAGPTLLVHVAGAVRRPGLYEFPQGARVADAIESAGGPTGRADLDAINLAELLVDGSKVTVTRAGESVPVADPGLPAPAESTGAVVSLNTADQLALEAIPGIGPVTATAILQHRDAIGGFDSLEQLLDVDGIGPATFESLRPYLTI